MDSRGIPRANVVTTGQAPAVKHSHRPATNCEDINHLPRPRFGLLEGEQIGMHLPHAFFGPLLPDHLGSPAVWPAQSVMPIPCDFAREVERSGIKTTIFVAIANALESTGRC